MVMEKLEHDRDHALVKKKKIKKIKKLKN